MSEPTVINRLHSLGVGVDKDTLVFLLRVKPFPLLEKYQGSTSGDDGYECYQTCNKSGEAVDDDETEYGSSDCSSRPVDVSPLKTHKFKGTLQSPEKWVVWVAVVLDCAFHSSVT